MLWSHPEERGASERSNFPATRDESCADRRGCRILQQSSNLATAQLCSDSTFISVSLR